MEKKLYRSPRDGILLGIASGIGHYFKKDPVFVRLLMVAFALLTEVWPMVLLYAILYLIIPVDPAQATVAADQEPRDITKEESAKKEASGSDHDQEEHMESDRNM
jgi:phage shock protein C